MLIKCAPIYAVSFAPSILVILVGGITFLLCSMMAISQSNGKRVLAYSTVANLGLITACAGVGTAEAIWAAILLVIFHAVAKSLLFLCVGTAEHHIGSRDIEDMDLLFERMPRLSRMMIVGIMIMFLAPFGMLVAKWATLVSFVDTRQFALLLMLAFGSAATFMFWAKWLGKLAGITGTPESIEKTVHWSEWIATMTFTILALVCCAAIPLMSDYLIEPYIASVLGIAIQPILDDDLYIAAIICLVMAVVLLGGMRKFKKNVRKTDAYLAGISVNNAERTFVNSLSQPSAATARNWYLEPVFGEAKIRPIGTIACYVLLAAALLASVVFAIVATVLGCLLAGLDRKVTARMQGRVGPPLLQPYYDVRKLFSKENTAVNTAIGTYVFWALIFTFIAGGVFFCGGNLRLCIFIVTLAEMLFIMAAYAARSPYAEVGAHRETLQVMAYEPMVLLLAVGFFLATGSFNVSTVLHLDYPIIGSAIGVFLGLLFILTIKLRKSPFDLSYSHHAHQDLVKGVTTEMSGKVLGQVEIMHWCENILFLAWVAMFFIWDNPLCIPVVIVALILIYLLEIWIDNNFARVKWQLLLKSAWVVTLIFAGINIGLLIYL